MATKSPEQLAHEQWLGYIQPEGLVVSIPALLEARAHINQNQLPRHRAFLEFLPKDRDGQPVGELPGFLPFAESVLGWSPADIAGAPGGPDLPESVQFYLRDYGETLRPSYAVRDCNQNDSDWLLLIDELPGMQDFDAPVAASNRSWQASPQARFERLLHETKVSAGLLVNQQAIRLVYAPRGESSGFLTFRVPEMIQVAGRPLFAALEMLLGVDRLFNVEDKEKLPAILSASRKYQNVVSTKLAGQVMAALYELLRGFQAANDQSSSKLLAAVLERDPNRVYQGLLTVLLRLVFILFAEDRGLLSTDPIYTNNYGIGGLFERLREDDARYPDTMDQRFGAWARLLTLFRLIYDGGSHGPNLDLPARRGYLFEPGRYPFLEGRNGPADPISVPRVSDGVLHRVLENLLILGGERLSYRNLDVEQIGSVYEAVMGFTLEVAKGPSIAITSPKKAKGGAPVTINLDELLRSAPSKRPEWLLTTAGQKLGPRPVVALKAAGSIVDLLAALDRKIEKDLTPAVVPAGSMIFQPSPERRRSGSHYTPRSLTSPIVEAALAPVLKQLGATPEPEQILDLKICDPAMGSGAFLVEACRQLGEHLLEAWRHTDAVPPIPPDEDELLHARRVIAQRCLYGVDKNDMAVDLAKLSLWLATLAREHPFTFLDHALRHGDSLVGFSVKQISYFNWSDSAQADFFGKHFQEKLELVLRNRAVILEAADTTPYETQQQRLAKADEYLVDARRAGDMLVAAFFAASKQRAREADRVAKGRLVKRALESFSDLQADDEVTKCLSQLRANGVMPFHWEIEFPEVFRRGGFDVIVGNPPFMRGKGIGVAFGTPYRDWLTAAFVESNASADIVAFFFRRAFEMLRPQGAFGLIATQTISKGDTRLAGLRYICTHGGTIFAARKRLKWPGVAAVVVSTLHVIRGDSDSAILDQVEVPRITAFLFTHGGHENPVALRANSRISFNGCALAGVGFTFDDEATGASSVATLRDLVSRDARNSERVFPYLGGEEINSSPTLTHRRYVIFFAGMSLDEASRWPDLLAIVRDKVKPERDKANRDAHRIRWWQFGDWRPGLFSAVAALSRMLCVVFVSEHLAFAWLPTDRIVSHNVGVFATDKNEFFCVVQSRIHEAFATQLSSGLEDRQGYRPSDGFEPFPFPLGYSENNQLKAIGEQYYEYRASLMLRKDVGLTELYNCFHDPGDQSPDILRLRGMHDAMDIAVLAAYGWFDIAAQCEFIALFDEDEVEDDNGRPPRQKYRYRWPDKVRDEVLARLLALNRERYAAELLAGPHDRTDGAVRNRRHSDTEEGLDEDQGELNL